MIYTSLAGELQSLVKGSIQINEPMRKHTTWKIGGKADLFLNPSDKEDIRQAVEFAREKAIPITVIGNGSNLLVKDGGIRGLVIKVGRGMAKITIEGTSIKAGAGALLPELAVFACKNSLGGFGFAAGIPGSLGGAIVMNAGAMNGCVSDVLQSIVVLNERNQFEVLTKDHLNFAYRTSNLQSRGLICVETCWQGYAKDQWLIEQETKEYLAKRKAAQPQGFPNAGSVFKNPEGDFAGRLIEGCGGKGLRVGDAEVSSKHANWILNLGRATAQDVLILIDHLKQMVQERFGVLLQLEVKVLGED
ncbi:UDP-N-acetylmuramate dehydrogenase [Desulforamulus reducens MI-1]|uniref:UDP-N-acetylenolpyruvoylglucosamine reductase n=1 Tax=Desulforamulus reducens (strain ATCC BAA-1160 / DSM 100696 / MI-1) TaxID=349161 RepID=MURB_DESRM|nr:UDP-N-acetylmuramate dehydrogenase [Desulforamulus reducens]A4J2B3.1 RecName: Full=UDP-N-acetylenolpyruvoylglucosamine reductase; AltName: Full=UDP-N-acetylmuramate dehydrogenase [Desulforamulus reducens MI-1]ABO49216.1 UDP-N-acetylmuramate dehydrogenase [Desulforamulus reducens MI-1]